jgi:hypothetical protein
MKTKLLLALWACLICSLNCSANDEPKFFNDTIIIKPDTNIKVIFIGTTMKEMTSFEALDTLKNMLIADVAKAKTQPGYPQDAHTTHYFVSEDGKRRVKAESQDFIEQGIDVEKEARSIKLGLPKYSFIIHDLRSGNEIQIYLDDPSRLSTLANYSFTDAIKTIAGEKKIQRTSYRVDLERSDKLYMVQQTHRDRNDLIEITVQCGFGLIGNQWSPAIGADLVMGLSNKYGVSTFRIGGSYLAYSFPQNNDLDFSKINFVQGIDAKFMFNMRNEQSKSEKNRWFGVTAGKYTSSEPSGLDNRWKVGIVTDNIGPFNFKFETVFLKEKKAVYAFTMLIPF